MSRMVKITTPQGFLIEFEANDSGVVFSQLGLTKNDISVTAFDPQVETEVEKEQPAEEVVVQKEPPSTKYPISGIPKRYKNLKSPKYKREWAIFAVYYASDFTNVFVDRAKINHIYKTKHDGSPASYLANYVNSGALEQEGESFSLTQKGYELCKQVINEKNVNEFILGDQRTALIYDYQNFKESRLKCRESDRIRFLAEWVTRKRELNVNTFNFEIIENLMRVVEGRGFNQNMLYRCKSRGFFTLLGDGEFIVKTYEFVQ